MEISLCTVTCISYFHCASILEPKNFANYLRNPLLRGLFITFTLFKQKDFPTSGLCYECCYGYSVQ